MAAISNRGTPANNTNQPAQKLAASNLSLLSSANTTAKLSIQNIQKPKELSSTSLSQKSVQPVYVTEITNKKELKKIQDSLEKWLKIATRLDSEIQIIESPYSPNREKINDNLIIIDSLLSNINNLSSNDSVFCAFDTANKLQAVAIASVSKRTDSYVSHIATHPDNIPYKNKPSRFQGAGTAVMISIMTTTLREGNQSKNLTLAAYDSPIGFFKKLGFKVITKVSSSSTLTSMAISPRSMEKETGQSKSTPPTPESNGS